MVAKARYEIIDLTGHVVFSSRSMSLDDCEEVVRAGAVDGAFTARVVRGSTPARRPGRKASSAKPKRRRRTRR